MAESLGKKKSADPEAGGGDGKDKKEPELGTCQAICYGILDVLGMIFRSIVACVKAIFNFVQQRFYYVKESFFDCFDAWSAFFHPYNSKQPAIGVDRFLVYDSVQSANIRAGKGKK